MILDVGSMIPDAVDLLGYWQSPWPLYHSLNNKILKTERSTQAIDSSYLPRGISGHFVPLFSMKAEGRAYEPDYFIYWDLRDKNVRNICKIKKKERLPIFGTIYARIFFYWSFAALNMVSKVRSQLFDTVIQFVAAGAFKLREYLKIMLVWI